MTGAAECRYHGRDFTPGEMALLRALIAGPPALNRHTLSKEFCRAKPDGGLKDMMARVTMLAMHKDGLITLPPPKWLAAGHRTGRVDRPLDLHRPAQTVERFVARHHYLGHTTLGCAAVQATARPSPCSASAPPGSSTTSSAPQRREKNLRQSEVPRPGSKSPTCSAIVRRRLPEDWTGRYNTKPVLIETFVAAIHRRRLQGFRLDPCRPLRDAGATIERQSTSLVWLRPLRLENPQPVTPYPPSRPNAYIGTIMTRSN